MCIKPLPPAATKAHGLSPNLIAARADFAHTSLAAWSLVTLCSFSFYLGPLILLSPLLLYPWHPRAAAALAVIVSLLAFYPIKPWPRFRKACQVLYAVFDVRHNFAPELNEIAREENRLVMFAQHPHAIIPLHGFVWGAICDQLLPDMFGYGCTTDAALYLPVLRHMLHWTSAGSARRDCVLNEMQNNDQNLWILPGGVAEIFLSRRRRHPPLDGPNVQTVKARRYGLMKLALETGAAIYPSFVFGASDMLDQLTPVAVPDDGSSATRTTKSKSASGAFGSLGSVMQSVSRKVGGGITLYFGQYLTPIPYNPRMSIVLGDPIYPVADDDGATTMKNVSGGKNTCKRVPNPTHDQVEDLMERYVAALHGLFEQYKHQAGYPNDSLRIT